MLTYRQSSSPRKTVDNTVLTLNLENSKVWHEFFKPPKFFANGVIFEVSLVLA